jgi:S1-C subfamily serine protease
VRFYNLSVESGVLVVSFESDSPAAVGGIREGDVIIEFDGHRVAGIDDLHRLLTEDVVGRKTKIEVLRGTERVVLTVKPREAN